MARGRDEWPSLTEGEIRMIVVTRSRRRKPRAAVMVQEVPSPEQISELTAEIRKSWTHRERCRRANVIGHMELSQMPLLPRRKGFWGD
jgi:hypothetical protein